MGTSWWGRENLVWLRGGLDAEKHFRGELMLSNNTSIPVEEDSTEKQWSTLLGS